MKFMRLFLCCYSLCLLAALPVAAQVEATQAESMWSEDAPAGGDFTLQSTEGSVSLQKLRGKVVLLFFGYANCPDVCPLSLSILSRALNGLEDDELAQVQGLFVTLDPSRDNVNTLKEYAAHFHPNILGLSGSEERIAEVAELYGVQYYQVQLKDSSVAYSVNHSAASYLIGPDGQLRFIFPHNTPYSVLLEAIQYALSEA